MSYNTEGGYGRKNVDCPDLRRALLEAGLAHVFSVSGPADEADLKAQAIGIKAAAGYVVRGASIIAGHVNTLSGRKAWR